MLGTCRQVRSTCRWARHSQHCFRCSDRLQGTEAARQSPGDQLLGSPAVTISDRAFSADQVYFSKTVMSMMS